MKYHLWTLGQEQKLICLTWRVFGCRAFVVPPEKCNEWESKCEYILLGESEASKAYRLLNPNELIIARDVV